MTVASMLLCGAEPLEQGLLCRLPIKWGGTRATLEILARAGRSSPQGNGRAGCTAVAQLKESDGNGACQH